MADISLEAVTGKLNRVGYEPSSRRLRQAKGAGNRNVELAHWLFHILQKERSDISADRRSLQARSRQAADGPRRMRSTASARTRPRCRASPTRCIDVLDRGWHYATLFFGETQIRTGHLLVGGAEVDRAAARADQPVAGVRQDQRRRACRRAPRDLGAIGRGKPAPDGRLRVCARPARRAPSEAAGPKGTTALDRFSQDLTAKATSGEMDPILGRDEEIRQIIDVLMRRRQNNPILTGEAGVGKTAVVEGFAQRIASGDVPPPLRGVRLCALDIGLMQAGASMKGEFEQRLRSVIDEVQNSPTPIILFIDEAHTLIGAGGAAGTGDAANLLKPALARGTLRTIAATTWSEYRQYFEKDPALTRRFQPIQVGEPDVETLLRHAARHPRADGKAPQGPHLRRRDRGGRATCRTATSRRGSCRTRR